jgi:hypothetical protein
LHCQDHQASARREDVEYATPTTRMKGKVCIMDTGRSANWILGVMLDNEAAAAVGIAL